MERDACAPVDVSVRARATAPLSLGEACDPGPGGVADGLLLLSPSSSCPSCPPCAPVSEGREGIIDTRSHAAKRIDPATAGVRLELVLAFIVVTDFLLDVIDLLLLRKRSGGLGSDFACRSVDVPVLDPVVPTDDRGHTPT